MHFATSDISRRAFLTAAAGALAAPWVKTASAGIEDRPNVLFISIDDLNSWIGVLGTQPAAQTPFIDQLAREGTLFAHAYCPAPACRPSRESVLRGILPNISGVYANHDPVPDSLRDRLSLPGLFRRNGYRTIGGGKVFHGSFFYKGLNTLGRSSAPWESDYPAAQDWDLHFPFDYECLPDGWPLAGIDQRHFDWGPIDSPYPLPDSALADWAAGVLKQAQNRPFFMALGFYRPHLPWHVPAQYLDRLDSNEIALPVNPEDAQQRLETAHRAMGVDPAVHARIRDSGKWRAAIHAYLAAIAFVDDQLGKVLAALDNGPNKAKTHVVLWSDNGWHLGEKLHWKKFTLWEEATRVPFIIRPAGAAAHGVCTHPVSVIDSFRTLAGLCNLEVPPDVDGQDLRPLIDNPDADWSHPALSFWGPGAASVRLGAYRYTEYANGHVELYDHQHDPREWHNRAGEPALAHVENTLAEQLPRHFAPASRGSRLRQRVRRTSTRYRRWVETAVSASDPCAP